MEFNNLVASFLFGMVGMGMFMYGKRSGQMIPLVAGVLLMVVPYFIPNLMALVVISSLLVAAPMMLRKTT
jgi:hypothetical protein